MAAQVPSKKKAPKYGTVTMEEVATHNSKADLWIVVDKKAYDHTKWLMFHPGGHLPLINMAGKDATDAFEQYHPNSVWKNKLPAFHVADVTGPEVDVDAFTAEHRAIRQKLLADGLFETDMTYFYKKAVWLSFLLVTAIYFTVSGSTTGWQLFGACFLGMFWQQLAFVGHDTGHNGVTHIRWLDNTIGICVGNLLGGVSIGWWKRSHNVHHIVCNSIEHDPDIQHMPVLAVDKSIVQKPYWSTYHNRVFHADAIARFLLAYQHYLFYPVMAVARFNLYLQSIILLIKEPSTIWKPHFEALALVGYWTWFGWLCTHLAGPWTAVAFLLISHSIAGILHVQICLSHFSMNVYNGHTYEFKGKGGAELRRQNGLPYESNGPVDEWFRTQLATTMNVDCPEWMDWFHGGLQFQIEHHLFPRLPRHNLRKARKLVKAFAAKHKVEYHEVGFLQCNYETLVGLKRTAMEVRGLTDGDVSKALGESLLVAGLNAEG